MDRVVTIVGFGAQGRAQALNLREAGWTVRVALRPTSPHLEAVRREALGLITDLTAAAREASFVALLIGDSAQPALWRDHLAGHLPAGACVVFAHGYNIHYQRITPRADLDIVLAAPLASGEALRRHFVHKEPTAIAVAVHQDASGAAHNTVRTYAAALTACAPQLIPTTFQEETEIDLFSEQALSCGGLTQLITAAFETLIAAGYGREMAYYTCLHEVQDLATLFATHGIAGGFAKISTTARYGALTRGPRVINPSVRAAMTEALAAIRNGQFAKELAAESATGFAATERLLKHVKEPTL